MQCEERLLTTASSLLRSARPSANFDVLQAHQQIPPYSILNSTLMTCVKLDDLELVD